MSNTEDTFNRGLKAYEAGDYRAAEEAFSSLLRLDPNASEVCLNLGNVYYRQEQFPKAEAQWLEAIRMNPLEDKAYLNLGNLYYNQGQLQQAIFYWEVFHGLKPQHITVSLNLGMACEALQDVTRAHHYYGIFLRNKRVGEDSRKIRRRLVEAKNVAEHNLRLAEKAMKSGQLKKAAEGYEQSLTLSPFHPVYYQHYATVLFKLKSFSQAAFWYELAIRHNHREMPVYVNLGVLYHKMNQPFDALWAFSSAIRHFGAQVPEAAVNQFNRLWEQHGVGLLQSTLSTVDGHLTARRYAEAEALLEKLADIAESHAESLVLKIQEKHAVIENMRSPSRKAASLLLAQADQYRESGQYEKALAAYEQYQARFPDGEKIPEVKARIEEIGKVISAVIGSLLSEPNLLTTTEEAANVA